MSSTLVLPELGLAQLLQLGHNGFGSSNPGTAAQFMASWLLVTKKGRQYFIVNSDNTHYVFDVPTLHTIHNQLIVLQFKLISLFMIKIILHEY